jgi:hydroxymethylglutaryl-CoA lyase
MLHGDVRLVLINALAMLFARSQMGISVVDAAVAGLGGCPFAAGATGNVATEDVLYMLHGLGIETGVDLDLVVDAGRFISDEIRRPIASRASNAILAQRARKAREAEARTLKAQESNVES